MGLSYRAVFEINDNFSRKSQIFPTEGGENLHVFNAPAKAIPIGLF